MRTRAQVLSIVATLIAACGSSGDRAAGRAGAGSGGAAPHPATGTSAAAEEGAAPPAVLPGAKCIVPPEPEPVEDMVAEVAEAMPEPVAEAPAEGIGDVVDEVAESAGLAAESGVAEAAALADPTVVEAAVAPCDARVASLDTHTAPSACCSPGAASRCASTCVHRFAMPSPVSAE